jgi:hypothetical protein
VPPPLSDRVASRGGEVGEEDVGVHVEFVGERSACGAQRVLEVTGFELLDIRPAEAGCVRESLLGQPKVESACAEDRRRVGG